MSATKCLVCDNRTTNPSGLCYVHENVHRPRVRTDSVELMPGFLSTAAAGGHSAPAASTSPVEGMAEAVRVNRGVYAPHNNGEHDDPLVRQASSAQREYNPEGLYREMDVRGSTATLWLIDLDVPIAGIGGSFNHDPADDRLTFSSRPFRDQQFRYVMELNLRNGDWEQRVEDETSTRTYHASGSLEFGNDRQNESVLHLSQTSDEAWASRTDGLPVEYRRPNPFDLI